MVRVNKFSLNPRTLDDAAIKDGLEAVSILNDTESYFLVGGVASQSYLPTRCRRPTADIDFALVRPLSKPDFRIMISPVQEYLHDMGYNSSPQISDASSSYALLFWREGGDSLCLEFVRKSRKKFQEQEKMLVREYNNSRQKIIEGRERTYRVCSPEDVVVPKLVRSINTLRRNQELINLIPSRLESLSDEDVEKRIRDINQIRAEAMANPKDHHLSERLRFVSDIYDIRILSELTGFNPEYFAEAERDWHDIEMHPELREKIFKGALPMFFESQKTK